MKLEKENAPAAAEPCRRSGERQRFGAFDIELHDVRPQPRACAVRIEADRGAGDLDDLALVSPSPVLADASEIDEVFAGPVRRTTPHRRGRRRRPEPRPPPAG